MLVKLERVGSAEQAVTYQEVKMVSQRGHIPMAHSMARTVILRTLPQQFLYRQPVAVAEHPTVVETARREDQEEEHQGLVGRAVRQVPGQFPAAQQAGHTLTLEAPKTAPATMPPAAEGHRRQAHKDSAEMGIDPVPISMRLVQVKQTR